jgi:S-formylglutathione hydrolase FrmB
MFGDLDEAVRSDKNPRVLIEQLKDAPLRPAIYLCCGTEDRLLPQSRTIRTLLEDAGFAVTYVEGPGNHNWDFWDTYIKKALDWLPLDSLSRGKNSGNVD